MLRRILRRSTAFCFFDCGLRSISSITIFEVVRNDCCKKQAIGEGAAATFARVIFIIFMVLENLDRSLFNVGVSRSPAVKFHIQDHHRFI